MACLHHLFERWVDQDPQAPAIASEEQVLTYGNVEILANRLAQRILSARNKTGDPNKGDPTVGIYLYRSAEAVVAILAVLKAGAAYVPMDPSTTPIDRVSHIIKSASISALVTSSDLEQCARSVFSGPIVIVSQQLQGVDPIDDSPMLCRLTTQETSASPERLCYVLYTSGTTGRPKGVMTEHRNVVSFLNAFNKVLAIERTDRIFQGFALGFDGSVEEMWMAFSNGATLVVNRPNEKRIGDELADWLNDMRVTVHSTVPTALSLIENADLDVRLLILSGEPCTPTVVKKWATPGRRLLNVYGPTEATVNTTWLECRPDKKVTIGIPLQDCKVLILDKNLCQVDIGKVGELFIGGPTIARGYLNAPELTAKSFVRLVALPEKTAFIIKQDKSCRPVLEEERYYRTGDLVRRINKLGELDFLGRIDTQVKIRGYRVELSEIEAVAAEDPNISRAVATLFQHGEASSSIVLYFTSLECVDRLVLMEALQKKLPQYMVPTFLEHLTQFPTLPSGKVDHSKLPAPSQLLRPIAETTALRSSAAPLSIVEQHIAQVFQQVLGMANPPLVNDCFFTSLGGDSFSAAQVVHHLRQDFGYEISMRDIYGVPKVQQLAALIEKKSLNQPEAIKSVKLGPQFTQVVPLSNKVAPLPPPKVALELLVTEPLQVRPVTRFTCHFFQAMVLALLYGFYGFPYLVSMVAGFELMLVVGGKRPFSDRLLWLIIVAVLNPILMIVMSIAVKWTIIGRYRQGDYPLYGLYYFRWWITDKFHTIAISSFTATPWMNLYFWLMGAKVGKRCVLGTARVSCFDMVHIGDDTSIGSDTELLGCRIENGLLRIGRVDIGSRVFVGIHSCLGLNVHIGDDAKIDDLTAIQDGQVVGSGEELRGSPPVQARVAVPEPTADKATRAKVLRYYFAHWLVWWLVSITTLVAAFPSLIIGLWMFFPLRLTWRFLVLPFMPVLSVLSACLVYAAFTRVVAPSCTDQNYSVYSIRYLQRWYVDAIMTLAKTNLHPLYTTIYCPSWLRLMGTKIGPWAEISTVSWLSPDLTVLGPQSFFADGAIIGGHRVYCGMLTTAMVCIGKRSFVGNSAIVPTGSAVGNNCLLGVLSAPSEPPSEIPEGSEWIGNPAFRILHRNKVEGFAEHETHHPTPNLVCQRLVVDFFRIWIPGMIQSANLAAELGIFLILYDEYGTVMAICLFPPLQMGLNWISLLLVVALKRALIWRFTPIIRPLWSMFVWINELINGAYETVMAPTLVPLLGTPFCVPPLRWLGCNIGRRCWIGTTLFSEFDLVNIGSDTVLNAGVIVQNHLFEDRIMKASTLSIGNHCNIGNMSVILYDSIIGDHANIAPLSLVMKGETIPPGGNYDGIPTQRTYISV